jgi:hypothetical protein
MRNTPLFFFSRTWFEQLIAGVTASAGWKSSEVLTRGGEAKADQCESASSPYNFAARFICNNTATTATVQRDTLLIESTSMSALAN